ncbi:hypothetical protein HDU92_008002 [Lobulomyces angularis]|nr:hypothetical protein HDU92_008002 [Lobulomyces angularis]
MFRLGAKLIKPISLQQTRKITTNQYSLVNDDLGIAYLWNLDNAVETVSNKVYHAEILNGAPAEILEKQVRIYQPAKTAMQSGRAGTKFWKLDFDVEDKWENPLMGWTSSSDANQALQLKFRTKEEAMLFAERNGYTYWVDEPKVGHFRKKVYADNYLYVPGKLRLQHTK